MTRLLAILAGLSLFGVAAVAQYTPMSVEDASFPLTMDVNDVTVDAGSGVDTAAAGALLLGAATATSVEIGDAGVTTDVQGPLTILGTTGAGLDAVGATALYVGEATATSLILGASDITTTVAGPLVATSLGTTLDATAARVLTSADYGKLITFTNQAAIAVTLPANGAPAGTWIDICQGSPQNDTTAITVSSTPADTLMTANSADSDSVTFGAGHRIGSYLRFISDGTYWIALNLGQTTMTVTDTD